MTLTPLKPEEHFQRLLEFLELEADAEKQQALRHAQRAGAEAGGETLTRLALRDEDSGLGGRVLWTLGPRNQTAPLPWTRLGPGSPVILSEEGGEAEAGWRGVVARVTRETIQVSFAQWPEPEGDRPSFRLERSPDEISRQRQREALQAARAAGSGTRLATLRDVLLGAQPPLFGAPSPFQPFDPGLNESQLEAIRFALAAEDLAIFHGPPGTGKTRALVEFIRQLIARGERVLAVAPSNLAVDNLAQRLAAAGEKPLRLGHPARVMEDVRAYTLDDLATRQSDWKLAQKLAREARALRDQSGRFTRARPEPGERKAKRDEARQMLAEARQIEDQVVERLLAGANLVCATATGLERETLGARVFDWCVMDEASQCVEPSAWIPLQFADRLALAGDPFQLPPTVVSPRAAAGGFGVSLQERLMRRYGARVSRRLAVQYRMHRTIMGFSSAEFYDGELIASDLAADGLLSDLPGVPATPFTTTPLDFIDTAGASYDEAVEPDGESRFNPLEAALVEKKARALLAAGLSPAQIAVITPYSAQARVLRERLNEPELEIDSVDGFQGREKEAVVLSLVRSNRDGEIGFLEDTRRMNVALTRARRKLIVIGDSATIASHPFYQRLLAYFDSVGAYHSVWEEPEDGLSS